jgi:SAM-dependent methyltransferase
MDPSDSAETQAVRDNAVQRCDVCRGTLLRSVDREIALCKCTECGFLFRSPRPSPSRIAAYYSQDNQYDDWLTHEQERDGLWLRRLRIIERYKSGGRLLDVGTGIGQFLALASRTFDVDGTEVSSKAIEIAKSKYNLNIRPGTIDRIDFAGKLFDIVTAFHVLEHVESPRALLTHCRELLVDDGVIVVAVPNDVFTWKRAAKQLYKMGTRNRGDAPGKYGLEPLSLDRSGLEIHLSHFTPRTLQLLFTRCGFHVVDNDVDPCHALSGFKKALHDAAYYSARLTNRALGFNFGEAIWMAGVKSSAQINLHFCQNR